MELTVSIVDWMMERFQDALLTAELDPGLFRRSGELAEKKEANDSSGVAAVNELHIGSIDFGLVTLLASVLVVPRAGLKAGFDVDQPAFGQVLSPQAGEIPSSRA